MVIDNIQVMSWDENNKKGRKDVKEGRNNKPNQSVKHLPTGRVFHSISEASRQTGVSRKTIGTSQQWLKL